jgi:hypothetical protein
MSNIERRTGAYRHTHGNRSKTSEPTEHHNPEDAENVDRRADKRHVKNKSARKARRKNRK